VTPGLSEAPGIGRLLSENSFTVPNHQRDYSWTKDEVRELIEDITSALDSDSPVYFIGLMETRWAQMIQTLANVRSDQFLKVFWTSRHGRIRSRKLFDTFKRQYPDSDSANDLSIDMLAAAEQYAALETADDPVWAQYSSATRASVRTLKVIGSQ